MDDVAKRAGVGVGTVYRHFPTKEALVEALAIDLFEKVLAAGKAALELEDPWAAFTDALWAGARAARRPTARSPRSSASCRADAAGPESSTRR